MRNRIRHADEARVDVDEGISSRNSRMIATFEGCFGDKDDWSASDCQGNLSVVIWKGRVLCCDYPEGLDPVDVARLVSMCNPEKVWLEWNVVAFLIAPYIEWRNIETVTRAHALLNSEGGGLLPGIGGCRSGGVSGGRMSLGVSPGAAGEEI